MAIIPYGSSTLTNTYTATLTTNWTANDDGYYTQTLTVGGILASDNPIIDIIASTTDYENEQTMWGRVFKAVTSENAITFYASKSTELSLTLNIKVVR